MLVALPDHRGPLIVSHVAECGDPHAQPGHGDARVRDQPTGGQLNRLDVKQLPPADCPLECNRPNEDIDGAGAWAKFWYVTLPLLKPVIVVVVLFSLILTFADFQLVYVLTRGGPANSTHLFATLSHQVALGAGRLGEGAAIALFMFPVLFMIVILQLLYIRKGED